MPCECRGGWKERGMTGFQCSGWRPVTCPACGRKHGPLEGQNGAIKNRARAVALLIRVSLNKLRSWTSLLISAW